MPKLHTWAVAIVHDSFQIYGRLHFIAVIHKMKVQQQAEEWSDEPTNLSRKHCGFHLTTYHANNTCWGWIHASMLILTHPPPQMTTQQKQLEMEKETRKVQQSSSHRQWAITMNGTSWACSIDSVEHGQLWNCRTWPYVGQPFFFPQAFWCHRICNMELWCFFPKTMDLQLISMGCHILLFTKREKLLLMLLIYSSQISILRHLQLKT